MNQNTSAPQSSDSNLSAEELELARIIVVALNLDVAAESIDPVAPLYGDGLGLDSIDVLEVALVVSKTYGVQLKSEEDNNQKIFSSLRNLSQHIQLHKAR